jgi:hypothetical protein
MVDQCFDAGGQYKAEVMGFEKDPEWSYSIYHAESLKKRSPAGSHWKLDDAIAMYRIPKLWDRSKHTAIVDTAYTAIVFFRQLYKFGEIHEEGFGKLVKALTSAFPAIIPYTIDADALKVSDDVSKEDAEVMIENLETIKQRPLTFDESIPPVEEITTVEFEELSNRIKQAAEEFPIVPEEVKQEIALVEETIKFEEELESNNNLIT